MNHDSGFIIGIAHASCKNANRAHTKKPPSKESFNLKQPFGSSLHGIKTGLVYNKMYKYYQKVFVTVLYVVCIMVWSGYCLTATNKHRLIGTCDIQKCNYI